MASATAHGYSGTWSIPEMESLIANIQKRMEWINTNDTTCQPLRKIYRRNLTYLYQNSRNIHLLKVGLEAGGFHSQDFASIKDEDSFQNFKQVYDIVFKTPNCNGLIHAWKTSGNEHLLDLSAQILREHRQDPSLSGFGQDDPLPQNVENNPQHAGNVLDVTAEPSKAYSTEWDKDMIYALEEIEKELEYIKVKFPAELPLQKFFKPKLSSLYDRTTNTQKFYEFLDSFGVISSASELRAMKLNDALAEAYDVVFKKTATKNLIQAWHRSNNDHLLEVVNELLKEYAQKKQ